MLDERWGLLERHLVAENAHDLENLLPTLTADCVFEDLALGRRWAGHAGAAEHYQLWWEAFRVVVEGERLHMTDGASAVAETRWRGVHIGEFLGVPPTRRTVEFAVAVVIDFRDGLMAGERFYWDRAGLLEQIGGAR